MVMGASNTIKPDIMAKVWTLHKKGVEKYDIQDVLGISASSVGRIITIMTATANGDEQTLSNMYRDCPSMKKYAREILGLKDEPNETELSTPDNTAAAMANVLKELHRTNELLERLCAVWNA